VNVDPFAVACKLRDTEG